MIQIVYIILCNFQNKNSQILPTKTAPGNLITDYQKIKKKERNNKKEKDSKHFCKNLQGILGEFP